MKSPFVNYEIALALKELGFDMHCFGRYYQHGVIKNIGLFTDNNTDEISRRKSVLFLCNAPLWQQVIDWLREEHNLHINFSVNQFGYGIMFSIIDLKQSTCIHNLQGGVANCYTCYEARTQAILKALELINKTIT